MKKTKVTKFKNTLNTTVIPATQEFDDGFVGKVIEGILRSQGLPIDSANAGPDIEEFGLEIKTHRKGSKADVSIGSMTVSDIATTNYHNSVIKEKLQTIRWVEHEVDQFTNANTSIVKEDLVLDFDDPVIQDEFEFHYNKTINEITTNNDKYKINKRVGWWEKKTENSWAFRVPISRWKKYVKRSRTRKAFNEMFSDEECSNAN